MADSFQNNSNSRPTQRQTSICCARSAERSELSFMSVAVVLLGVVDVRTHHCQLVLLNWQLEKFVGCRQNSGEHAAAGAQTISVLCTFTL